MDGPLPYHMVQIATYSISSLTPDIKLSLHHIIKYDIDTVIMNGILVSLITNL